MDVSFFKKFHLWYNQSIATLILSSVVLITLLVSENYFQYSQFQYSILNIVIVVFLIITIISAIVVGITMISYQNKYEQDFIPHYLHTHYPQFIYSKVSYLPQAFFKRARFIFSKDWIKNIYDHLSTMSYGGLDICQIEIQANVKLKFATKGIFIAGYYPFSYHGVITLIPSGRKKSNMMKSLQKVTLESTHFNRIWDAYADSPIGARLALRTDIMDNLIELQSHFKKPIFVHFEFQQIFIFIESKTLFDTILHSSFSEEKLNNSIKNDLEHIIAIVDSFKLSQN